MTELTEEEKNFINSEENILANKEVINELSSLLNDLMKRDSYAKYILEYQTFFKYEERNGDGFFAYNNHIYIYQYPNWDAEEAIIPIAGPYTAKEAFYKILSKHYIKNLEKVEIEDRIPAIDEIKIPRRMM